MRLECAGEWNTLWRCHLMWNTLTDTPRLFCSAIDFVLVKQCHLFIFLFELNITDPAMVNIMNHSREDNRTKSQWVTRNTMSVVM